MKSLQKRLAKNLKNAMKKKNLDVSGLSKLSNVSKTTIYRILNSKSKRLKSDILVRIVNALDVTVDSLLFD